jgi:hypothetical protein
MKKKIILKEKIISLTKIQLAELFGIKCAALLETIRIGGDGGVAETELFNCCNGIFVDYARTLRQGSDDPEDTVGKAMDIFWEIFLAGKYVEMNKFVGFVNTIILRLSNTKPKDIDKNPIINVDIEEAIENPKNDSYFEDKPDVVAIREQDELDQIDKVVPSFSKKDQNLFKLLYKDKLLHPDIAETLDLTAASLRKAITRLQQKIRDALGIN